MQNFFKNLLSRKTKQKINENVENQQIQFEDLKLQKISIKTITSGNVDLLQITEEKSGTEILLDSEKSFLLSIILQDYTANKNLKKSVEALSEKE